MKTQNYSNLVQGKEFMVMARYKLQFVLFVAFLWLFENATQIGHNITYTLIPGGTATSFWGVLWAFAIFAGILFVASAGLALLEGTILFVVCGLPSLLTSTECEHCDQRFKNYEAKSEYSESSGLWDIDCPHCGHYLTTTRPLTGLPNGPINEQEKGHD